jgi:CheY-like chemotaxis protein
VKQDGEFKVLLVDDSKDDAFFVRKALEKGGMGKSCMVVEDGEEAIKYLCGKGIYGDRRAYPFPTVILSDLKMPRMSGFSLLRWVREHPECSVIPTIVFSSSAVETDVKEAYRLGANAYIVKPTSPEEFEDLMRVTCQFWTRCERPPALEKCAERP